MLGKEIRKPGEQSLKWIKESDMNKSPDNMLLVQDDNTPAPVEAGVEAGIAREQGEIQAACVLARSNPRNPSAAMNEIGMSCKRPTFADKATYRFPRGGREVAGPSIDFAREMARCWGNIRYGLRVITEDDDRVHIEGFAYDIQTNARCQFEDKFAKKIQRRRGGETLWITPDERDLRELVNRRGAICVRNAILSLIPSDIIDAAMDMCKDTRVASAKGELQTDRSTAIKNISLSFQDIGVTAEMIEDYLGHSLNQISDEDVENLRGVYKSIADGNSKREEYFKFKNGNGDDTPVKSRVTSKVKKGGKSS